MKTKKVMISGLAFDSNLFKPTHWLSFLNSGEATDMLRLQALAKEGWNVTSIKGMHYVCVQGDPEDVKFAIDYKDQPDEEYFSLFKASGWTHIDSVEYIHLFKARPDTKEIITDQETRLEKMIHEQRRFGKYTLYTIFSLLFINLLTYFAHQSNNQALIFISLVLSALGLIAVIFTLLPYLGYFSRVNKIKKKVI